MATRDRLSDLPVELALQIFGYLQYTDLLPVLGTCRSWRQIAIDCPAYWYRTNLDVATEGQAHAFISRMRGAKGRLCSVAAQTPVPWPTLLSAILPEIASILGCIHFLGLSVHTSQRDAVFHVVDAPARELTSLLLGFAVDSADTVSAVLPRSLFKDEAPRLRTIFLINVNISTPLPVVFEAVTVVSFGYQLPATETKVVPDLGSLFPNMRALTVVSHGILGDDVLSEDLLERLEWLKLQQVLPALLHSFEHHLNAISRISNVHISCPYNDIVDQLLNEIPGPMQVALHVRFELSAFVNVVFGDAAWRRSRAFCTLLSTWTARSSPDCGIFSRPDIAERIVSLALPAALWQSATHRMVSLRHLSELRLILDVNSAVAFPQLGPLGKIVCPELKTLVLRVEEGEYHVTLDQVRAFASAGLRDWHAPIELQFENVTLEGYGRILPDDDTFTYCWTSKDHWDYPDVHWD